jgi:polyphosphate glucokinase
MKRAKDEQATVGRDGPRTLAIDVGGTGIKASVLNRAGRMTVKRVRVATPYPCRPATLLRAIMELTASLPPFDRISIGFPGVIRDGRVITAPHFDAKAWNNYALEQQISRRFGKPTRLLNDAEVQGLGIVSGSGLEVVLTLGTGIGSAVFRNGQLAPHLELAQHPIHKGKTYNDYVGNRALLAQGSKKWSGRVLEMIEIVDSLLHYDVLYLGGGNAEKITVNLPKAVRTASNDTGITGGIRLWDEEIWQIARDRRTRGGKRAARMTAPSRRRAASPPARAATPS